MKKNFECRYLSVSGYCMDEPTNFCEKNKFCDRFNKCMYCTWMCSQTIEKLEEICDSCIE